MIADCGSRIGDFGLGIDCRMAHSEKAWGIEHGAWGQEAGAIDAIRSALGEK